MSEDRILYLIAIPIILIFVLVEYLYRRKSSSYSTPKLSVITSNLFLGLIDRLFFLFFGLIQYEIMKMLQDFSFFQPIENKVISIVVLFLVVDFIWYSYHRVIHRIPLLWAFHCTHHQTDEFSLTLGFRLSFLLQMIRAFFWIPIVFLGFNPIHILIVIFIQNFYQFFIHTEIWKFPKLFRNVLVTPQSHKLHHSNEFENRNANFGGVLVLWDKLFRTYKSPYGKEIKMEGLLSDSKYLHPINGLFLPLNNWLNKRQNSNNLSEVKWNSNGLNEKKLFRLFLLFLIPSLLLIFFSSSVSFIWLLIFSLSLIIAIFIYLKQIKA